MQSIPVIEKKKIEELKKIYKSFSPDIDTQAVNSSNRVQRNWHSEKLDFVWKNLGIKKGIILDIGCGSGGLTFKLAEKISPIKIVGVDFNEDAIKASKIKAKALKTENISFVSSAGENIPFEDSKFDAAISLDVMDHFVYYY